MGAGRRRRWRLEWGLSCGRAWRAVAEADLSSILGISSTWPAG